MLGALAVLALGLAPAAGATAPYVRKLPPLLTPWTKSVSTVLPLPEYPRPQFEEMYRQIEDAADGVVAAIRDGRL